MNVKSRAFLISLAALLAAGCATHTGPGGSESATGKAGAAQQEADWQNLGVTPNGNVMNEIDKLSIKKRGSLVSFRDRKTIFNLKRENYGDTPRHKVSINNWQIDCQALTYRLLGMTLFDENNRVVASYSYNDKQLKPAAIIPNSASYQQMQFVCGK